MLGIFVFFYKLTWHFPILFGKKVFYLISVGAIGEVAVPLLSFALIIPKLRLRWRLILSNSQYILKEILGSQASKEIWSLT